jgi:hypothetical protein
VRLRKSELGHRRILYGTVTGGYRLTEGFAHHHEERVRWGFAAYTFNSEDFFGPKSKNGKGGQ